MTSIQFAARGGRRPPAAFGRADAAQRAPRIATPFARDVLAGLARTQKAVPCTWLYDTRGAALFEEITQLDAYYPTRTEIAILERCAGQIAAAVGPGATLVEFGSGSCRKTPLLLRALDAPAAYVPIDISAESLAASTRTLRSDFAQLPIHPIAGDLADAGTLTPLRRSAGALGRAARSARPWGRRLGFFPGSTIGNFAPDAAALLLDRIGRALGDDSMLVVGVDSTLDRSVLIPAYDDHGGVTAAFNKNLLERINRELAGDFDPIAFRHEARFNAEQQRVEMHLVSKTRGSFEVLGRRFAFPAGDSIHTESSHKYSLMRFHALARCGGWAPVQFWADARARFGVHVLERVPQPSPHI